MNLADNLKKLRKDNNMSQEDLAEKLGVSRQSVSKWESGQAYPEMDKVLQLCKLFNLNINDLLNEDINEVKEKNDKSNKYNKYVDDFLNFITKTVELFGSLRFRDKIRLLLEEVFLILVMFGIYYVLGDIFTSVFSFVFNINKVGSVIYALFNCVYSIAYLIIAIIVLVHIFKLRYLDYYKIVDKEDLKVDNDEKDIEIEEDKEEDDKKNTILKKEEKIIIRDDKHSSYSFLKGLANIFVFFIKIILFFILIGFISAFIANVICLILIFMIINNGLLFSGLLIGGLGSLLFITVIAYIIYYIIVNKKIRYKLSGLLFLISFLLLGIGIGLGITSIKNIEVIGLDGDRVSVVSKTFKMSDDLYIEDGYYYKVEYIEEDRKDILVITKKVGNQPIEISKDTNYRGDKYISFYEEDFNLDNIKQIIEDLNHKKVYDFNHVIEIHASKKNIAKLIETREKIDKIAASEENINDEEE